MCIRDSYASVRMDIRRIGAIKDGTDVVGNRTKVKVVKNKVAPPFREVEFDIVYGEGISQMGEIIDMGMEHGMISKSGSWFSVGETRVGQGRDSVKAWFKEHPEERDAMRAKLMDIISGKVADAPPASDDDEGDDDLY